MPCGLPLSPALLRKLASLRASPATSSDDLVSVAISAPAAQVEACRARMSLRAYLSRICSNAQAKPCAVLRKAAASQKPEELPLAGMLAAVLLPCEAFCRKLHRPGSSITRKGFPNAPR